MISKPEGSYFNQMYARHVDALFWRFHKTLEGKIFDESDAESLCHILKEVCNRTPFELRRRSDEPAKSIAPITAFGYRIPVWKVIDKAIASENYGEDCNTREQYINSFIKLLPDTIRFMCIVALLIETDTKFTKLGFQMYLHDTICSSDMFAENAGKSSYQKVKRVIEKIAVELKELYTFDTFLCATQEELDRFFLENHELEILYS